MISGYPNSRGCCCLNIEVSMIGPGQSRPHLDVLNTTPNRDERNVVALSVIVPVIVNVFVKLIQRLVSIDNRCRVWCCQCNNDVNCQWVKIGV